MESGRTPAAALLDCTPPIDDDPREFRCCVRPLCCLFETSGAAASMPVLARHSYQPGGLAAALEFLKRTRSELRSLRLVRIWTDKLHVIDVNNDTFEIEGIGYTDSDIAPLLDAVNTAYNPRTLHEAVQGEYKEFSTGRRYPWAQDRVM